MDLSTERKIKFWLSAIVKVLVIALVIFKLIPYLMKERNHNEKNESVVKNLSEDSLGAKKNLQKRFTEAGNENEINESLGPQSSSIPKKNDITSSPLVGANKIGIAVYSEEGMDNTVTQQLEATVFKDFEPVAVPQTTYEALRQNLLGNNFSTFRRQMAKIAVGTTTYHFTQKENRYSCELTVRIDTYDIQKNVKIKEFSGSVTRYGIGFSKQQAMQVAIDKLQSL